MWGTGTVENIDQRSLAAPSDFVRDSKLLGCGQDRGEPALPDGLSILRSHSLQNAIIGEVTQARSVAHRDYEREPDADIAGRAADGLSVVNQLRIIRGHVAMNDETDAALRHPC